MAIIIDFENYRKTRRPTEEEREAMRMEKAMNEPFMTTHNEIQAMIRDGVEDALEHNLPDIVYEMEHEICELKKENQHLKDQLEKQEKNTLEYEPV